LKSPFIYTIEKKAVNLDNDKIIQNFKLRFKESKCDEIKVIENKQINVENKMFKSKADFGFNFRFNIWYGINNANVIIKDRAIDQLKDISYSVNFTSFALINIILLTVSIIWVYVFFNGITKEPFDNQFIIPFAIYIAFVFIMVLRLISSHQSLFEKSLTDRDEI
jgi:hypothetical protein